jgi:hypothetical protein
LAFYKEPWGQGVDSTWKSENRIVEGLRDVNVGLPVAKGESEVAWEDRYELCQDTAVVNHSTWRWSEERKTRIGGQ